MQLSTRINAFIKLGQVIKNYLQNVDTFAELKAYTSDLYYQNSWFTAEFTHFALNELACALQVDNLHQWLNKYNLPQLTTPRKIGVVMAGNIPLVGFHDFLCVLITGNIFVGKVSQKDEKLFKIIAQKLIEIEPDFKNYYLLTENYLKNVDAIIATGSNNTARYFEYYFGKYPNIIRKNRNSVAVLSGHESFEELELLADDIFLYFGLGCRNVSKIYVPENYDFQDLFPALAKYKSVISHNKYVNNYDYNKAIYLVNNTPFFDTEFVLFKEEAAISSPVSVVYFEKYANLPYLEQLLQPNKDMLQCVVASKNIRLNNFEIIPFGQAQKPALWQYADNIDTIEFLLK